MLSNTNLLQYRFGNSARARDSNRGRFIESKLPVCEYRRVAMVYLYVGADSELPNEYFSGARECNVWNKERFFSPLLYLLSSFIWIWEIILLEIEIGDFSTISMWQI